MLFRSIGIDAGHAGARQQRCHLLFQALSAPAHGLDVQVAAVGAGLGHALGVAAVVAAQRAVQLVEDAPGAAMRDSIPVFVLAYLLILLFSLQLHWLPVQGYRPIGEGIWPWLKHLILPSLALGTVYAALIARITRASILDVLAQDYIRTAQAKGLKERDIMIHHALKNAAVPIITIIGIGIGLLISGAVVTETVFAIPGIGRLTVDAILRRDYPIIQGVILIFSATYVIINLLIDLSYVFFDPRIRY